MAQPQQSASPQAPTPPHPAESTRPTPHGAAAGSPALRQAEQAEIAAENRQTAVEGSDDYLRRNQGGVAAAEAAVGKPAPGADGAEQRPLAP